MTINWDSLWKQFESEPIPAAKPFIKACLDPNIQFVGAFCGIQSAKTLSGADATYALLYGPQPLMLPSHIRGKTPMEVWLVSKSYQLCETQLETFRWRTPAGIWATDKDMKRWGVTKGDRYTHWLMPRKDCEDIAPIKLRLRTSRDPEAMRATPVLGLLNGDEAAYWPEKSIINAQGRAIVARTKFIFTTSPRGKDYIYRNIAVPGGWPGGVGPDPKVAAFGWTSADNPYADKEHLARLRRILGKEYAKQELDGTFTDHIGYVYGMFDRHLHMKALPSKDPEDYDIIVGGIDPGMRDPFAAGVWGRMDGGWYQLWEFHQTGQSAARLAPIFKATQDHWNVKTWFVDKRRPSEIQDLRDAGVNAFPNIDIHRENDRHTIAPMVGICRELLRNGKLFIGEDHEWTAEEFEKYHYQDDVEEREKNTQDIPVDWMNHHMDQMRYAICSVEDIPDVKPRYRQGSRQEPKEFSHVPTSKVMPSVAQSLAAQDDEQDAVEARNQSGKRNTSPQWLRNRLRMRERLT